MVCHSVKCYLLPFCSRFSIDNLILFCSLFIIPMLIILSLTSKLILLPSLCILIIHFKNIRIHNSFSIICISILIYKSKKAVLQSLTQLQYQFAHGSRRISRKILLSVSVLVVTVWNLNSMMVRLHGYYSRNLLLTEKSSSSL